MSTTRGNGAEKQVGRCELPLHRVFRDLPQTMYIWQRPEGNAGGSGGSIPGV
jgi:hypothetical protein